MSRPSSLRWGVLVGAAVWTAGLFVFAGVGVTWFIYHYPRGPIIFHTPFTYVAPSLAVALACMAVGFLYVRKGLSTLTALRDALSRVRTGVAHRVSGAFPSEVLPLVDDLNALLEHREVVVQRAHARAGDLAHGLKTPLAVLAYEAEQTADPERAEVLRAQVDRMRRQIDYHLAHMRAAASGATPGASSDVAASAEALVRTLRRLHAERGLAIDSCVPAGHTARVQREDLDEMLGNLLDNACKWGRTTVEVSSRVGAQIVQIVVEDDGPGVPAEMRTAVMQRGVRADEAAPGSGLGLAIVADLAGAYGGAVSLDASPLGGARACLTLPGATDVA